MYGKQVKILYGCAAVRATRALRLQRKQAATVAMQWEGKVPGFDAQVRRPICNAHYPLRVEHQRKTDG